MAAKRDLRSLLPPGGRFLSDILSSVTRSRLLFFPALILFATLGALPSRQQAASPSPQDQQAPAGQPAPAAPPQEAAPQQIPPAAAAPANPPAQPQAPPPPPVHWGPVVVLDPEHGGTDDGARGANGLVEKDVVLKFAQTLRAELERQGYRVVLTRNDDSDPSYDDRDAAANMYRDAVFISLHVGTTGAPGTVRTYFYSFWTPIPPFVAPVSATSGAPATPPPAPPGWIPWQQAQRNFAEPSSRLADALQSELLKQFGGSPAKSIGAEVRELRSVAAPAAAVEVSSVLVSDPAMLANMAQPLASAIVKGLQDYRPRGSQGGAQ